MVTVPAAAPAGPGDADLGVLDVGQIGVNLETRAPR